MHPRGRAILRLNPWDALLYFLTLFLLHVRPAYKIVSSYPRYEHTHMVAARARERTPKRSGRVELNQVDMLEEISIANGRRLSAALR